MPDEEAPCNGDVKFLTDFPLRFARKLCPYLVTWLDALGYEQALVVRDVTHLSLYFSCLVSFIFSAMWLVDVFTLNCSIPRPWETEYVEREVDNYRCFYEAIGGIIFFGTLRDSIQMLGNYDNQHRELLERKKQLMADLHTDIVEALRKAKENADKLYGMLFEMYVSTVGHHVEDFFHNILPTCSNALQGSSRQEDLKMLRRLADLIGENVSEPGQLSTALCKKLMEMYQKVCPNAKDVNAFMDTTSGKMPRFWTVWMRHSTIKLQEAFSSADFVEPDESDILRNPGRHVFLPVEKIKSLLEGFLHSEYLKGLGHMHRNAIDDSNEHSADGRPHLMGFGTPSWAVGHDARELPGSSLFICCLPRLMALVLLRACCLCCCIPGKLEFAMQYPKRVRLGFFWFQIISKLHERLIQGIIFSVVLTYFLARGVVLTIQDGCPSWMMHRVWWACFWHNLQNSSLLFALLWHIPASIICAWRIKDLDAIIKIMADIRKLQDIRRAIQDFDRSLKADAERQALLQHIEDRVLTRIQLVEKYRLHIMQRGVKESPRLMRQATCELIQCLELAADTLRPASEWLKVPSLKQQERVQKVKAAAEDLASRNFEPSNESNTIVPLPCPRSSSSSMPVYVTTGGEKELADVSCRPLTPPLSPRLKPMSEMSATLLEEGGKPRHPLR